MTQSEPRNADKQELSFLSDRYCDISLLGSGGMGKLYRGFDTVLTKPVAIKVLSSKRPDNKMVLRFQQEAKLASRLQHTNIVKVLDFGAGPENELYLIMDLVEGRSLQDFVEAEGPQPVEKAIPLFMQMCDGLKHAHNNGVIHRDVKPSNIMITGDERTGLSIRIVDFGLARLESRDVRITQTGDTIGTPLYISPEQIRGDVIDFRADIYSLGCVIFTVLTGEPPFRGTKALDTFQLHLHAAIPSLAEQGVEHPAIDELDRIVQRMLAKSPDDRYQNLSELRDDLAYLVPEQAGAVKKNEDAYYDLKIPFLSSSSLPIPKWALASLLCLVIGVPLLMMALTTQEPVAKVVIVHEVPLEENHMMAPHKAAKKSDLFYEKKKSEWNSMDCRVTDEDLSYLSSKVVKSLDLPTTRVQGWGLKFLKNQPLETLDLGESKLKDENLHYVNGLKQLDALKLCYTWITSVGLKTIEPHPSITHLSFEGCRKLNDESVLEAIRIAPNMRSINLSFMPITGKGLSYLKDAKNLKAVTIGNNEFKDDDLLPLHSLRNLTLIDISKCKYLTDLSIKRMMKRKHLQELLVRQCPLISSAALNDMQKTMPQLKMRRESDMDHKKVENLTSIFCTEEGNLPELEF